MPPFIYSFIPPLEVEAVAPEQTGQTGPSKRPRPAIPADDDADDDGEFDDEGGDEEEEVDPSSWFDSQSESHLPRPDLVLPILARACGQDPVQFEGIALPKTFLKLFRHIASIGAALETGSITDAKTCFSTFSQGLIEVVFLWRQANQVAAAQGKNEVRFDFIWESTFAKDTSVPTLVVSDTKLKALNRRAEALARQNNQSTGGRNRNSGGGGRGNGGGRFKGGRGGQRGRGGQGGYSGGGYNASGGFPPYQGGRGGGSNQGEWHQPPPPSRPPMGMPHIRS